MFRALTKLVPRRTPNNLRWFSNEQTVQPKGADSKPAVSDILKEQEKKFKIPVHLRPYDKTKYEVPSTKIKLNSGFALMEIEPFPRARIMRICYNILEKIQQVPEVAMYRQFTEEKIKHLMTVVDETEDIQELQKNLGVQSIQMFIYQLAEELDVMDYIKAEKPWVKKKVDPRQLHMMRLLDQGEKNPRYQKDQRLIQKFLEEEQKVQK